MECKQKESKAQDDVVEIVVMLVGQTGVGKTTLRHGLPVAARRDAELKPDMLPPSLANPNQQKSDTDCIILSTFDYVSKDGTIYRFVLVDTPGWMDSDPNKERANRDIVAKWLAENPVHAILYCHPDQQFRNNASLQAALQPLRDMFPSAVLCNFVVAATFAQRSEVSDEVKATLSSVGLEANAMFAFNSMCLKPASDSDKEMAELWWKIYKRNTIRFLELCITLPPAESKLLQQRRKLCAAAESKRAEIKSTAAELQRLGEDMKTFTTEKAQQEAIRNSNKGYTKPQTREATYVKCNAGGIEVPGQSIRTRTQTNTRTWQDTTNWKWIHGGTTCTQTTTRTFCSQCGVEDPSMQNHSIVQKTEVTGHHTDQRMKTVHDNADQKVFEITHKLAQAEKAAANLRAVQQQCTKDLHDLQGQLNASGWLAQ